MKKAQTLARLDKMGLVVIDRNHCWTSSVTVAKSYGKRHNDVMNAIKNLFPEEFDPVRKSSYRNGSRPSDFDDEEMARVAAMEARHFARTEFREDVYRGDDGKDHPQFWLSKDAFNLITNAFTGGRARFWRIRFMREFSRMQKELDRVHSNHANLEWQQWRAHGKLVRRELVEQVDSFVRIAKECGSTGAPWFFKRATLLIYDILFEIEDKNPKDLRERLNATQLIMLAATEAVAEGHFRDALALDIEYKAQYAYFEDKMMEYGAVLKKTSVPAYEPSSLTEGNDQLDGGLFDDLN